MRLALAAAAAALIGFASAAAAERFTFGSGPLTVYNLAGEIHLAPTSGGDVVVEVTLSGRDADELRVVTDRVRGVQVLRVVYPGDRVVYPAIGRGSNSTLRVSARGEFGDHDFTLGGRRVTIAGSGRGLEAHADLRILVPKGTPVNVRLGAGSVDANDIGADLDLDTAMGDVACHGTRGRLRVDTGSGAVRVSEAQGDLDLDTGSGDVEVADVRGADVRVDTGSGRVRAERVRAEQLDVDTGSGSVSLQAIDVHELKVDTGSGSVDVDAGAGLRECLIDTGSGSVTLALAEDFGGNFRVETGSGEVDVDLPYSVRRRSPGSLQGHLGAEGGTGSIVVDTGSGNVRIVPAR